MFYIFFRLMLHISFNMSRKNGLDHFAAMCLGITILDCRLLWRLVVVTLEGSMNYIIPPFIALSLYKESPKHNVVCVYGCVCIYVGHQCSSNIFGPLAVRGQWVGLVCMQTDLYLRYVEGESEARRRTLSGGIKALLQR